MYVQYTRVEESYEGHGHEGHCSPQHAAAKESLHGYILAQAGDSMWR